jgi:hypothetical protein
MTTGSRPFFWLSDGLISNQASGQREQTSGGEGKASGNTEGGARSEAFVQAAEEYGSG